jgi:hypothetical protein
MPPRPMTGDLHHRAKNPRANALPISSISPPPLRGGFFGQPTTANSALQHTPKKLATDPSLVALDN